jgi:hypothetical protein
MMVFPKLDLYRESLNLSEVVDICKHYDPNLKLTLDICAKIAKFDRKFPKPRYYQLELRKKITNPNGIVGGSKRSKEFWLLRGYSEEEATDIVSTIQKLNSPRAEQYWLSKGFSSEESKSRVSLTQSKNAALMHKKIKDNNSSISLWSISNWTKQGFSEEDAILKIRDLQKNNSTKKKLKYSPAEIRTQSKWCVEYWEHRGYSIKQYEEFMSSMHNYSNRSRIADEFCVSLKSKFPNNKIYCCEKEFGKYISNYGYVKYDYVDTTLGIVVEFNGAYWHKSEDAIAHDSVKRKYVESVLGFRYNVIMEDEYRSNRTASVEKMKRWINEDSN